MARIFLFVFSLFCSSFSFAQLSTDTSIWVNYRFSQNEPAQRILVQIKGDKAFLGDDIVLGKASEFLDKSRRSAFINGNHFRWPQNTIPYEIENNHPEESAIRASILHVNARTNIKLVPRINESDYVRFVSTDEGCFSSIGMVGGRQDINMGGVCGIIGGIHEIGHAIGLFHEQARLDRDDYVQINWDNILKGREGNFQKYLTSGRSGTDFDIYDYSSIMHYGTHAFSKNGQPTISIKFPPAPSNTQIGATAKLSKVDILAINTMYPLLPAGDLQLRLNAELAPDPNPICLDQASSLDISVLKLGRDSAVGRLQLFLHEKETGSVVKPLGMPKDFSLGPSQSLYNTRFDVELESVEEGRYLLALWTIDESGNPERLIGNGQFKNGILIQLVANCFDKPGDQYEFNDTEKTAFLFEPLMEDSSFVLKTEGSSIHSLSDKDYYVLDLPPHKNYLVSAQVFDELNEEDGLAYNNDVVVSERNFSGEWSRFADRALDPQLILNGEATMYRVQSHFPEETGTYAIEWKVLVDPNPMLQANQLEWSLEDKDTIIQLVIQSNRDWQITSNQDWMDLPKMEGFGFDTLQISVERNESFDERLSELALSTVDDTLSLSIILNQAGKPRILEGERSQWAVCYASSEAVIFVNSNTSWEAIPQVSWLKVQGNPKGNGDGFFILEVDMNFEGRIRTGEVLLSTEGLVNSVNIVQPTIQDITGCLDPVVFEVGPEAGKVQLDLNSNTSWAASSDQDWISLISPDSGQEGSLVRIEFEALDPQDSLRVGRVNFGLDDFGLVPVIIRQGREFNTAVHEAPSTLLNLQVFPNPVRENLIVAFELKEAQDIQLKLYNKLGICLKIKQLSNLLPGSHQFMIQTSDLVPGIYLLKLSNDRINWSKKIIVIP